MIEKGCIRVKDGYKRITVKLPEEILSYIDTYRKRNIPKLNKSQACEKLLYDFEKMNDTKAINIQGKRYPDSAEIRFTIIIPVKLTEFLDRFATICIPELTRTQAFEKILYFIYQGDLSR